MKKYFLKLAFVALGVTTLVSCEEDTVTYGGKNFVTFDEVAKRNFPFFENGGTSEVPVNMAFPVSHDVTVDFQVAENGALAGTHYNLLNTQVVIPAGETTGYISIQVIDNTILNDSKSLDIKLTAIDDSNITLGLKDDYSLDKRFLIVNDDCTTTSFAFLGKLNFKTSGGGDYEGEAEAEITEDASCNQLLISGDFSGLGRTQAAPIRFAFAPTGSAVPASSGTISAYEQLWCEKCYTSDGKTYNILFSATGSYSTLGTNKDNWRMIVSGTTTIDGLGSLTETTVFTIPQQ